MGLIRRNIIVLLFITVTLIFSLVGFNPQEVVIGGPYFPQIEYFEEELALISKELNIKISYVPVSDIETQIIKEENSYGFDLAIIPNPQGVVNLGERGYLYPVTVAIDNEVIDKNYSQHLQEITTSNKDQQNYGVFFRLIPSSLIWYDVEKFNELGAPKFQNFNDIVNFTEKNLTNNSPLWCMDIESGATTGWLATNWLEDVILHEYGSSVYDDWSNQEIQSQNNQITLSILKIGKLIFMENAVFGGNEKIISREFTNNYRNLLDDEISCVFTWSGHFASLYFSSDKVYGSDFDFFKFPSSNNKNAMVGLGDSIVILNTSNKAIDVFKSLTDNGFGQNWISKKDSMFISANKNSDIENVNNKMLLKETTLIRNALDDNLFRYDASELMERRIGADHLLSAMRNYIFMGNKFITEITEELDSKY